MRLSFAKRLRRKSSLVAFLERLSWVRPKPPTVAGPNGFLFRCRASSVLLGIAILFQVQQVAALGLGELRTYSALNQPFYGEIKLLDVDENALDAVKASLASQSAFEQAGIERPHALTRLQFTPMTGPRGELMIQVITREPIREPYLDLLVEVIWPDGRLVKEYAVLLDPPAVGGQRMPRAAPPRPEREVRSPLVAAAQVSSSPPIGAESAASLGSQAFGSPDTPSSGEPAPPQPSREVAVQVDIESVAVDVEIPASAAELDFPLRYGPIRPGDGLIRIARRLAPPGATLEQTAMAIYRNSQDAFLNRDINDLRIGAELVIPTAAELFALPPQAALAQYRSALAGRPVVTAPLTDIDARLTIATSGVSEVAITDDEGAQEVEIDLEMPDLASEAAPSSVEALAPASSPSQADAVHEAELLLLREVSEANRQEATELRTRVKELESQLDDIRRLLELRNAQLSSLALAEEQTDGAVADEPAEVVDGAGAVTQPATADTSPTATSAAAPSADDSGTDAADEVSGRDPSGVISAWRQALFSWTLPLFGLVLLLALFGLVWQRRRRQGPMLNAVDVDDGLRGRDAVAGPFSEGLQLDSDWTVAQTAGARQVTDVVTGAESASIDPLKRQVSLRQGDAVELDDLIGEPAPDKYALFQHDILAPEPLVARDLGVSIEQAREPPELVLNPQESALKLDLALDIEPKPAPEPEQEPVSRSGIGSGELDGLAEANVYLTFGRYQDAERVLRETIAAAGETRELLFRLAETYLAAGDLLALAPLADRMRSAANPEDEGERWRRIENALAREAAEVDPGVDDDDDDDDDEELFLDLDELEQAAGASPALPPDQPSWFDQPVADNGSADEDQRRLELDLAALDALTNIEPSHAELPEPESRPVASAPSEAVESLGDLGLPILALLPDADAAALVATPVAEQGPIDRGETAVAADEGGDDRWPIESEDGWDEIGLKLDLARAYLDMDDPDAASAILNEVVVEGRDEQRREAEALLAGLS